MASINQQTPQKVFNIQGRPVLMPPLPVIFLTNPTGKDKYQEGQVWINKLGNTVWILTSIVNNFANWENLGGGTTQLDSLTGNTGTATPVSGSIKIAAAGNLSTSATAATVTVALTATPSFTSVTTTSGNMTATSGDLVISAATKGVTLPGGLRIISGAASPNGSVTAPKGSMYLRSGGASADEVVYVNTDSATTWTALTST